MPIVPPRPGEISVLMSTYNGAPYLEPQLASIYAQAGAKVHLIVRDDGSTDATAAILKTHADRGHLHADFGSNVGPRDSFFQLIDAAAEAEYVLFADQDDVWYPDKVRRSIDALASIPATEPALYCARVDVINAAGLPLGKSPLWPRPPSFGNALVENIAMGCTIALNQSAIALLRSRPWPKAAIMHDWWMYLTVAAFGRVIYDATPALAYRVHSKNTVGLPTDHWQWAAAKIRRQLKGSSLSRLMAQATDFDRLFGDELSRPERLQLDRFLALRTVAGRLKFLADSDVRRQFPMDNVALKVMTVVNRTR